MTVWDWATAALLLASGFFFLAGTVGLLRFPDVFTRIHAPTKADNLGLGLLVLALALQVEAPVILKLVLIWVVAVTVSAAAAYLIARHSLRGRPPEPPSPLEAERRR